MHIFNFFHWLVALLGKCFHLEVPKENPRSKACGQMSLVESVQR